MYGYGFIIFWGMPNVDNILFSYIKEEMKWQM
jgi:hypothetical protein